MVIDCHLALNIQPLSQGFLDDFFNEIIHGIFRKVASDKIGLF